ncbi:ABC transporter ATP-binding protein [Fusobacterium ulcerans]|uniref:ABC transporter ATP-binding protein n=1 Tax=Fusobacterium ulcerans TaxID=861 RepID=UPI00102F8801|nr:sn-glycerol-3-phosphate ABC transporter ATP-binding protein UgpC [Fusobacterium ulcerans]
MSGVTLKNIEKIYSNGFKAVHGIDLEIKSGEFMVLVGPSGCAKSTMLRMIAGLEDITRGELWIEGKLSNKLPPKDRGIAMVFQNYALYPHMTTYENMAFGLKMAKFSKKEIDKRVRETAERLEISDILDRKPKEMSGGQKQRVALGRAIVREPKVFLFDEPLSNLDAKLRVSMRVRITQLHKELLNEGKETIMIYVTHDQVEAMTMGDRICVLNKGKVMQVDTPMNIYNFPVNKFVAGFIGSPAMNIVEGELLKKNEDILVKLDNDVYLVLDKEKAEKVKDNVGEKIWFGIRPENIKVSDNNKIEKNRIQGTVSVVENMGNEVYIYFKIGKKEFTARTSTDVIKNISFGKKLLFDFNMLNIHIFHYKTEKNISK